MAAPVAQDYEDHLEALGFVLSGASRTGGRRWQLAFNSHLTFVLHDYQDSVVLSWSFALGDFAERRGWVLGSGENSFHDLYPQHDVRLPIDVAALEAEIRRVLTNLRVDLGDPAL